MAKQPAKKVSALNLLGEQAQSLVRIATVSRIEDDGAVFIDCAGRGSQPVRAKLSLCEADQDRLRNLPSVPSVLVLDVDNAINMPVIIGLLSDGLNPEEPDVEADEDDIVHLDVTALKLEAKKELVLHCGKSQIVMKSDGKIILRGTDVISRSSGPNRIRGATVRIN